MEHADDAPLADEPRERTVPNDQPVGGPPAGPEDENMPERPLSTDSGQSHEPHPPRRED